jgi:hypothetical protein
MITIQRGWWRVSDVTTGEQLPMVAARSELEAMKRVCKRTGLAVDRVRLLNVFPPVMVRDDSNGLPVDEAN